MPNNIILLIAGIISLISGTLLLGFSRNHIKIFFNKFNSAEKLKETAGIILAAFGAAVIFALIIYYLEYGAL